MSKGRSLRLRRAFEKDKTEDVRRKMNSLNGRSFRYVIHIIYRRHRVLLLGIHAINDFRFGDAIADVYLGMRHRENYKNSLARVHTRSAMDFLISFF